MRRDNLSLLKKKGKERILDVVPREFDDDDDDDDEGEEEKKKERRRRRKRRRNKTDSHLAVH